MPVEVNEEEAHKELLLGLIYGVLTEPDPLTGVDFAVKLAVCAKLTAGDKDAYGKAVRKAVGGSMELAEIFPKADVEDAARSFMRAARYGRSNRHVLTWLTQQFEVTQAETRVKEYLIAAERTLGRVFIAGGR